jgi:hypothetical protein
MGSDRATRKGMRMNIIEPTINDVTVLLRLEAGGGFQLRSVY